MKLEVPVELVETALRETTLRETKIDDVAPRKAEYIHTLEAQSSVDSDVIAHNVRGFSILIQTLKLLLNLCSGPFIIRTIDLETN